MVLLPSSTRRMVDAPLLLDDGVDGDRFILLTKPTSSSSSSSEHPYFRETLRCRLGRFDLDRRRNLRELLRERRRRRVLMINGTVAKNRDPKPREYR